MVKNKKFKRAKAQKLFFQHKPNNKVYHSICFKCRSRRQNNGIKLIGKANNTNILLNGFKRDLNQLTV